jgi:hypothetical protein
LTSGFDDYLSDLREQLVRCASDEAAAERARSAARAARRPWLRRPPARRAAAWAGALSVGVAALAVGLLMMGGRPDTTASTSGLLSTPAGAARPAYVQPVIPGSSATPASAAARPPYSLAAIAAESPGDVWSVGARGDVRGQEHSFVVHYDGAAWRETSVPDVGPLTAVAVAADAEAWALGPQGDILHWNTQSWQPTLTAAQSGGAVLRGLTALSPDDVWAVGSDQGAPFATHWDGTSWKTVTLPTAVVGGSFNAVSGTATDLWAVGVASDDSRVLTLHYDGTAWSAVPDAAVSDGGLLTVAALAPNDVWAAGDAVLQHYDGTQWRTVSQAFSGVREALAAGTAPSVWLAGAQGIAHFDGAAWQPTSAAQIDPTGGATAQLGAISALSPTDVWAAGTLATRGASSAPLIVHYDGMAWRPVVDSVQSR